MSRPGVFTCWLVALAGGCTDANIYSTTSTPNEPNKIGMQGEVCTDDPENVGFPVKVLVVMDGSTDMNGIVQNDPMTGGIPSRVAAVQSLVMRYQLSSNYSFAVLQYSDAASPEPKNGYFGDSATLTSQIMALQSGYTSGDLSTGDRHYIDGLRQVTTAIEDDLLSSPPGVRSRTRYKIIWVSFGEPEQPLEEAFCPIGMMNCNATFLTTFCPNETPVPTPAACEAEVYPRMVKDLRDFVLANGAQDLAFHTIALQNSINNMMLMNQYLNSMAIIGHGEFLQQTLGTTFNLAAIDLTTDSTVLNRREVVVFNPNIAIENGKVVPDSDGDGLSDDEEIMLSGSPDGGCPDPRNPDSDNDGVGDAIEIMLKAPGLTFDPCHADVFDACSMLTPPYEDRDQDGLNDCEEALLRTDPTLVDTDKDGIPDLVEVRRGGNPLADDTLMVTAHDGIADGDKMKEGLYVSQDASSYELDLAYTYRIADLGPKTVIGINPTDPIHIQGLHIKNVVLTTQMTEIGALYYQPGPVQADPNNPFAPGFPLLAWSDNEMSATPGAPVDISCTKLACPSSVKLLAKDGQELDIDLVPSLFALPVVAVNSGGTIEEAIVIGPNTRNCFTVDVRNITLVQTLDNVVGQNPVRGWQTLQFYLAEIPASTPNGYPVFDIAEFPVQFIAPTTKKPNVSFLELTQDQLQLLSGDF